MGIDKHSGILLHLKKRSLWVLLSLVIVCLLVLCFLNPQILFPYEYCYANLELRTRQPVDEDSGLVLLKETHRRLSRSSFFDPKEPMRVFVCQDDWVRKLFFLPQPEAGGLCYYGTGHVFLSGADFEKLKLVNSKGFTIMDERDLAYFATHELTHVLAERQTGLLHYHYLDNWVKEGYVDYVARGSAWNAANLNAFVMEQPSMNWPAIAPYLRFNLLVSYALEKKGMSELDLHFCNTRQSEIEIELRDYGASNPKLFTELAKDPHR